MGFRKLDSKRRCITRLRQGKWVWVRPFYAHGLDAVFPSIVLETDRRHEWYRVTPDARRIV